MSYSCAEIDECPRVLIVGGGVGGLYAAVLFAKEFDVTLCESSARVGGVVHTVSCLGKPVELGPSHHLHEHERVRALLAYGGKPVEKSFGDEDSKVRCEGKILTMEEVNKIEEHVLWGYSPPPKNKRRCVPWADETEAFDKKSALINVFKGKGKKMTAVVGYQKALERVADRLRENNVWIRPNTAVGKIHTVQEYDNLTFKAYDEQGKDLGEYEYVLIAVPPSQTRNIILPVPAPSEEETKPVSSSRIVLCFSNSDSKHVPKCFMEKVMQVGTHYVSDSDTLSGYRWAVVLSDNMLLLSYTDGERAEHLLEMEENKRVETVLASFLSDMRTNGVFQDVVTTEEIMHNCKWFAGGSTHAFHVPGSRALPVVTRDQGVFFVGEAYAPVEYRAWMEGACFTAEMAYNIITNPDLL